jgi:hypothetical protein
MRQDTTAAAHVNGAKAEIEYRTFEIDCPDLCRFLCPAPRGWSYYT